MTDDTTTGGSEPEREKATQPTEADQSPETRDASGEGNGNPSTEESGAATHGEPLSDSTDGGLEGGDPGVEE